MMGPRARAGTVVVFVFATGVLAGMAYERHFSHRSGVVLSAAAEHEAAIAELRDVVGLDDSQLAEVHTLLSERQEVVQHMWEQLRPEVQSAMEQVHNEIAELLRPDQLQRFHDWLTQRREQGLQSQH